MPAKANFCFAYEPHTGDVYSNFRVGSPGGRRLLVQVQIDGGDWWEKSRIIDFFDDSAQANVKS